MNLEYYFSRAISTEELERSRRDRHSKQIQEEMLSMEELKSLEQEIQGSKNFHRFSINT